MTRAWLLAAVLMVAVAGPVGAVEPAEILADPALEHRARDISQNLRCLVCQNQSIDDSNAELARDLRVLVRERLSAGDSDTQVLDYVVSRYGDYVLLKPPFKIKTLVLWIGPAVIVAVGALAVWGFYRRRGDGPVAETPTPLSDDEKKRLQALLDSRG